jgi:uncharacterized membrane protein
VGSPTPVHEVRDGIPDGSSGLLLLAERRHVDALIDAFRETRADVAIRRTLSDDTMAALENLLAEAPRASRDQPGSPRLSARLVSSRGRCPFITRFV